MTTASLFDDQPLAWPAGMRFEPEFIDEAQERALIALMPTLGLHEARYKQYTARRRVASFGGQFDYDSNELLPSADVPPSLWPLREQVARWLGVEAQRFQHVLVAEYRPGTPLGWHRDVPEFESIVGVSLGGPARMKFRPYPPAVGRNDSVMQLELPPRSIYVLEGDARWKWQHSVAPTPGLRYSISLRTRRPSAPLLTKA